MFKKLLRFSLYSLAAVLAITFVWTLASISYVRLRPYPKSQLTWESLPNELAQALESQFIKVRLESDVSIINASLTWLKGTNIFLTNEHVVHGNCDHSKDCSFYPTYGSHSDPYRLRLLVCVPNQDVCALYPSNENLDLAAFQFATPIIGEKIYYRDIAEKNSVYVGTITDFNENEIAVAGYGRNGFSGSPLLNERGEIVGILKAVDESSLTIAPHFLIFGWSQGNHFRAARWASTSWLQLSQEELNEQEWQQEAKKLASTLDTPNACVGTIRSWKTIIQVAISLSGSKNPVTKDKLSALTKSDANDELSIQKFCEKMLAELVGLNPAQEQVKL